MVFVLLSLKLLWAVTFYGETRILWGIPVTVLAYGDRDLVFRAVGEAFSEIGRVGERLSYYLPGSDVSRINRSAGIKPVKVSEETLEVIRTALEVSRITGGAFDPTAGPLIRLWDLRRGIVPNRKDIEEVLRKVDYRKVNLDVEGKMVFLEEKGMEIHLGGIIKGYLTDRGIEVLKKSGAVAGLVAVGGDVRVFGRKPDGRLWRIGIKDPRGEGVFAALSLSDAAVSTSGDYGRFFIKNGKRYHHIIDPRTGYPARGLMSVTVIAPSSAFADALATGLFVLGPERALELLKNLSLEGILITSEGKVIITPGIRRNLRLLKPSVEVETYTDGYEEDRRR